MDANDRCFKCSALLRPDQDIIRESRKAAARRSRRETFATPLRSPFDWLRHQPWFRAINTPPDNLPFKYPFTAGLLSIWPGLGHIYAGMKAKGILFTAAAGLLVLVAALSIRLSWSNVLLFVILVFWLLTWADAVGTVVRNNGETWRTRKTLALACAGAMLLGTAVFLLQMFSVDAFIIWLPVLLLGLYLAGRAWIGRWAGSTARAITAVAGIGITLLSLALAPLVLSKSLVTLERLTSSVMQPEFLSGDRVLFSGLPIMLHGPSVGDIVQFDPPRFTAEQGANVYSINITNYFQRVLGLPGDRVVKKDGIFFRNGERVADTLVPIGGKYLPDFDVVVPAESYFIPVTGIPSDALAGMMGAAAISHVGEIGYVFTGFPEFAIIPSNAVRAKAIVNLDPPARRRWL